MSEPTPTERAPGAPADLASRGTALLRADATAQLPTPEILQAMLANQGNELDDLRLGAALEAHRGLRPLVDRMRAIPLDYIWPIEPNHVFEWIEHGGTIPTGR